MIDNPTQDEPPLAHAGDLLDALENTHPRLGALLHQSDQARTLTLALLRSDETGTLDAIEAASRLLFGIADWVAKQPAPLAAEFASRITSDFIDAIDGMLEHKLCAVLDPSRDLMELSVLFREFHLHPGSFDEWQRADEVHRLGKFSFGRLLAKHRERPISGLSDIESAFAEYTQHSRTLHPAAPLTDRNELARAPVRLSVDGVLEWAHRMTSETLRHTMIAFLEFIAWHAERPDRVVADSTVEIDLELDDYQVVLDWMDSDAEARKGMIPAEFMEAFEAPYRRRPKPDRNTPDADPRK